MQKIAGDYGPRHLTVVDGRLHYWCENASNSRPQPLLVVSNDTFVLDGITYFKLRVTFDEQGNPSTLVDLYEDGGRDESPRDPK